MSFFDLFLRNRLVCAHRGARSIAPENTWLAMELARKCGSDLWETDVQLSADGELILFHDTVLTRTTDVLNHSEHANRILNVTSFTAAELASLDAGSWFLTVDPFATVGTGEVDKELYPKIKKQKIPLLCDVLEYCRKNNFPINLEIKDQRGTEADHLIVAKVLDCLKKYQCEELVLISSFNHEYLRQVKKLNPLISIAALVEENHPENLLEYLEDLGVSAYHPDQEITPTSQVRELVNAGLRVNLWTVNKVDQAKEYFAAGATFLCSDWPQRMVDVSHS